MYNTQKLHNIWMVEMKRILDFPDYKNCIVGYIRVRTTRVKGLNAEQLYQKFA